MAQGKAGRLTELRRHQLMTQFAELTLAGHGLTKAAGILKVAPQTCHAWKQRDDYKLIVEELRRQVVENVANSLSEMLPVAMTAVMDQIKQGDGKLALQLLRECGALATTGKINGLDVTPGSGSGGSNGVQIVVNLTHEKPNDNDTKTIEAEVCGE